MTSQKQNRSPPFLILFFPRERFLNILSSLEDKIAQIAVEYEQLVAYMSEIKGERFLTIVGIKDVAQLAKVSPATVSRVLAGRNVDPAMRARVEAAVKKTGYRPNLSARRLRSRANATIGLIVADIRNPFFTGVSKAIEEIAYSLGLRVILCNTDENWDKEQIYLRFMEEERVTGVIIAPTREGLEEVGSATYPFPIVLIDRAGPSNLHDAVVLDNHNAAAQLVRHLDRYDCKRIAVLHGRSSTGIERREGCLDAASKLGIDVTAQLVEHGADELIATFAAFKNMPSPPCAAIATNGVLLMAAARAAAAAGFLLPTEIHLVGFDNEPWTSLVAGGLPVIEQPIEEIGHRAMHLLLARIEAPEAPAAKVLISGRLVRGR